MRNTQLTVAFSVLFSAAAAAQNIPDAGALMRQTEQNILFSQTQPSFQTRVALPPEAVLTDATSIVVQRFKFLGNARLSDADLLASVKSFANRALNEHDLKHLTDAVTEEYRKRGWLVQAYIPRQDLTGAELIIQVIETIPPNKPKR